MRLRGDIIPLCRLDMEFGRGTNGHRDSDVTVAVVVKSGEKTMGLAVDSVLEPQETVVKSLGQYIGNIRGIAGATILGDGRVALILDTATLISDA